MLLVVFAVFFVLVEGAQPKDCPGLEGDKLKVVKQLGRRAGNVTLDCELVKRAMEGKTTTGDHVHTETKVFLGVTPGREQLRQTIKLLKLSEIKKENPTRYGCGWKIPPFDTDFNYQTTYSVTVFCIFRKD